jgi:YbbR domain-containing protein
MSGVRALLAENWPLKLMSVIFAMGLWLFVAAEERTEAVFTVPLELVDPPPGVEVTSLSSEDVIVRVVGRDSLLRRLHEEDFQARVSLKNIRPGRFALRVLPQDVVAPAGVRVVRVTPSEVRGMLETP